ncbi:hypothetical protein [Micromonospora tulbaghiae]|uniref:hypothetical protein n=1 Tax=Micromonospora tulbaghiae TaxID=479978 RepID=UPI003439D769
MPAKRNPKKSRKQSSPQVTAPNLDASPPTPAALLPEAASSANAASTGLTTPASALAGSTPARPAWSKGGPSSARDGRSDGRSQRASQNRLYSFRRR